MRILVIFLLTSLSTVSAGQSHVQKPTKSTRDLHRWAMSRTVLVVAGPVTPTAPVGSGVWISKDGLVATCWHVVENATEIKVEVAYPGVYDLEKNILVKAAFSVYGATVVASDKNADVAILKVSPNPFVSPPTVRTIVNGQPEIELASADFRAELPSPGDLALLAGYPLHKPDLLTQRGAVAGIALVEDFGGTEASKGVRILR